MSIKVSSGTDNIIMNIHNIVQGTKLVKWELLQDLQPQNLKTNFHSEKTKQSIIELGFARAIYVWQEPQTQNILIIDGHLRTDLLRELVAEGYDVPEELPCTFLDNTKIQTKQQAIQYLLRVFNIKTNPMDGHQLEEWLKDVKIDIDTKDLDILLAETNQSLLATNTVEKPKLSDFTSQTQDKDIKQLAPVTTADIEKNCIVLRYDADDYNAVVNAFKKFQGQTKEQVIYDLLVN